MVKQKFTQEDDELLSELGVKVESKSIGSRSPREERIIFGYEEIEMFFEKNGRIPQHGEDRDIFERLYAVRLDKIRTSEEMRIILQDFDRYGLLESNPAVNQDKIDHLDDETLLAELGVSSNKTTDVTNLKHVRPRAEINLNEEIAQRTPCLDFKDFKPLFIRIQEDLASGVRVTREFKVNPQINKGDFFIVGGQKAYIAELGHEIKAPNGETDARLRVIYDNGTESNLLRRSLQRALYKDVLGRRISDATDGPLFSDKNEVGDIESGNIYVLRSKSDHPTIQQHREVLHKIGVTSGDIKKRLINVKNDPTFLLADVEVVATYKLSNINRVKLENLIHKFFEPAKLDIEIKDRFGIPVRPREWFLVPLFVIDEMVEKIKNGSIVNFYYDPKSSKLLKNQ